MKDEISSSLLIEGVDEAVILCVLPPYKRRAGTSIVRVHLSHWITGITGEHLYTLSCRMATEFDDV